MIESRVFHIQTQANSAFSVMQELRVSQQLCDIVLCVGGAKFSAHRVSGHRVFFSKILTREEKKKVETMLNCLIYTFFFLVVYRDVSFKLSCKHQQTSLDLGSNSGCHLPFVKICVTAATILRFSSRFTEEWNICGLD